MPATSGSWRVIGDSGRVVSSSGQAAATKKFLQQKTRSALAYRLAILGVACAVSALLLLQIVPTFEQMFAQFGHDLPADPVIVDLSQQLQAHGISLVLGLLSAFTAARYAVRQHKLTRLFAHRGQLLLPIFGPLAMHRSIAGIANPCHQLVCGITNDGDAGFCAQRT